MPKTPNTKPPAILKETPKKLSPQLTASLEEALHQRHGDFLEAGESIRVSARTGKKAAFLQARVGTDDIVMEFEVFARDVKGDALDCALGVIVDFLDGVLDEFFEEDRDAYLPLDYTAHPYETDDGTVYVLARQEGRNYKAEEAADAILADGDDCSDVIDVGPEPS